MKKLLVTILISLPFLLQAAMGPDVSQINGKSLKWEEGAWDYFVMFKTLIKNDNRTVCTPTQFNSCNLGDDQPGNPQADACIDPAVGSTFDLISAQIPFDAHVSAAYLIWVSALPADQVPNGPTDNTVTLSFEGNEGTSLSAEIKATETPRTVSDPYDFSFGAVEDTNTVNLECTSDADCTGNAQLGEGWKCIGGSCGVHTVTYTYRADVTEFFETIHSMNVENGILNDGTGLLGKYTVTDMECTSDPNYVTTSGMVGGWSLVFVYTSEQISPKKIYFYDGFDAYRFTEGVISTSGFELPNEAVVRFTMIAAEGDPGLATSTNPDNPLGGKPPAEALSISGAQKFPVGEWLQLWNDCNQAKAKDSQGLAFNYTEVYNSISSTYAWDEETPFCVGGNPGMPDANLLEYAMDVDTFVLSAKDETFAPHLIKGDQFLNFKIGANQDQIYTNLIVVSIDTKSPKFDIPKNPETPDGREKNLCTCSSVADSICSDRPFYFTIKVENWGENIAENVTVSDELPRNVDYIPGSTEILKTIDGKTGKWEPVEDIGGEFPLKNSYQVMDEMYYCDKDTVTCEDRAIIRFKVKPIDSIQKNETIDNTAIITDNSGVLYYSNSSIPLRLKQDSGCPAITECPEPPKETCGGSGGPECTEDGDCGDGMVCDEGGNCVKDTSNFTDSTTVEFAIGKNSPVSDNSSIIITNPSKDLVAAQFTLLAEGKEEKSFSFDEVNISVESSDDATLLNNFKLIHDADGNGVVDEGEKVIATTDSVKQNIAKLSVTSEGDRVFRAGVLNYFIVSLDAEYTDEASNNVTFILKIDGKESFVISDNGTPKVSGNEIEFAKFKFEPANGFIITKGMNDPEVPSISEMNGETAVLQIRTKSMQGNDTLTEIGIKPMLKSVKFGEGIKAAYLYHDKNNDGQKSDGDTKLAEITAFESATVSKFTGLSVKYAEAEEKYLLIVLDLSLKNGELAQIQIGNGKVKLDTDRDIIELPVTSKEFLYECAPGDLTCQSGEDDDTACTITTINNSTEVWGALAALFAILSAVFGLSVKKD